MQGANKISPLISASNLIETIHTGFEQVPDQRALNTKISLTDALMSGFAMFSLKDSSLLQFDKRRAKDSNLQNIYQISMVPSDSQMRTILDPVSPEHISPIFKNIFDVLQQDEVVDKFVFMKAYYFKELQNKQDNH